MLPNTCKLRCREMGGYRAALRLEEEVEDDVLAVLQEQQVLDLQVAHPLRCCQTALPHLFRVLTLF